MRGERVQHGGERWARGPQGPCGSRPAAEHGLCTGGAGGGGGCGWGPSAPQGADAELQAHRSAAGTDGGPHCHRDPGEGQESRFLTLPLPQGGDEQIPKGPQAQASGGWCVTSEAPGASAASTCVTGARSREPGHQLGPAPPRPPHPASGTCGRPPAPGEGPPCAGATLGVSGPPRARQSLPSPGVGGGVLFACCTVGSSLRESGRALSRGPATRACGSG